jgi:hypothetical protein
LTKIDKTFRLNPQVYADFKDLASKNGDTATGALEKFMADAVKFGLVFPLAKNAAAEAEGRVSWLGLKRAITFLILGSYAFSFRSIGALSCSPTLMVFALVNSCKHPPVILIDAAAGQLDGFAIHRFLCVIFSVRHSFSPFHGVCPLGII